MRKKIGIITGSGPEAGIDLWQKILEENKKVLADKFTGDLDAPNVTIFSIPELGQSMELEKNFDVVWDIVKSTAIKICEHVDYFVIACNTLNLYALKLQEIGLGDKFISTLDVVQEYIKNNHLKNISLLGALPVLQMGKFSVFTPLNDICFIELPHNFQVVHKLIYNVKLNTGGSSKLIEEFHKLLNTIKSKNVFLACTELPLIQIKESDKNLIDVTKLLAQKLVEKSF